MDDFQLENTTTNEAEYSVRSKTISQGERDRNERPVKKLGTRISRLLKRQSAAPSSSSSTASKEDIPKDSHQKRRQQVYQAQKRHRNRQAEYVSNLEVEIAQLQHHDSVAHAEVNAVAHENQNMRELLASGGIHYQSESITLTATPIASEGMSQLGSAAVEVRFDPVVGHERTFVDVLEQLDFSNGNNAQGTKPPAKHSAGDGDNWAALDFILVLEHCCQDHTVHSGINPSALSGTADEDACYGHSLSTSAAVFQSAISPPTGDVGPENALLYGGIRSQPHSREGKWQLPHSEIDKLVAMSEKLPMDNSEMTPAQAYSAIRESVPDAAYVKPVMEALKVLLAPHVACFGFGAVMPSMLFWEQLDTVLKTLGLQLPRS